MQIAKDMERWAKNVNAAKTVQKQQLKALIEQERAEVVAWETVGEQQQQQQQVPVGSEVKRSGISLTAALEVSCVLCVAYEMQVSIIMVMLIINA